MLPQKAPESRDLLKRLKDTLAEKSDGQERLDQVARLISESIKSDVCSIYLMADRKTLELCASHGLDQRSVHKVRLGLGEGLVGRIANETCIINTPSARSERGFRFLAETGEDLFPSFLGVPIIRMGVTRGVLVVQTREERHFSDDNVYALEVVAMVIAEMTEMGAFSEGGGFLAEQHKRPVVFEGAGAQEGAAEGTVLLHEPRFIVSNFAADDPDAEKQRLNEAMDSLRISVDQMLLASGPNTADEHRDVLQAYRMFANSRSWKSRLEADIDLGLSAEAAVEKEQSETKARMLRAPDAYFRERLADLNDLSNRLMRFLTNKSKALGAEMPENPILVANNIGPGELLEYGRKLKGVVLEEGSVGSHAAIVARALAIPLVIRAENITEEALNGDAILVDGDRGVAHLRPEESVASAFRDKILMESKARKTYSELLRKPAQTLDGVRVALHMNAGLMADLPSLKGSGAEGVGLFRTELQFLIKQKVPRRDELAALYSKVMDSAGGLKVVFRTVDIGSDKVLPYMKRPAEPNPALGWRAIRVGLDRPGVMRMQLQALIRSAKGRPLSVMFPFIAQFEEYTRSRDMLLSEIERERKLRHPLPEALEIGAMLETPSLAFAPKAFFDATDFISIGGNDLKQFFFAADRENERVRRRYDTLNVSFLSIIEQIVRRCAESGTPLSFCGEDAGRPITALCIVAMGVRQLSMRPASIGPVKNLIRKVNLAETKQVIDEARVSGSQSVRGRLREYLANNNLLQFV